MSRTPSYDPIHPQIADEAAEWFVEFASGEPDFSARRDFDRWIRKSPEHLRAYLEMFPIWEDAQGLDAGSAVSADELIERARADARKVVPMSGRKPSQGADHEEMKAKASNTHRGWRAFAAGIALAALGIGGWLYSQRGVYATDVGEQRLISLPDGSDIELNARSRIRLQYGDRERRIELLAGQALFKVAKDARRPFIVASDETEVRAVGTLFDVYRKRSGTTITVVEGRVAVRASSTPPTTSTESNTTVDLPSGSANASDAEVLLSAGEQLRVTPAQIAKSERTDVSAATAWRERRLVFSGTPLTEVADEFNRYNSRQLIVEDERLREFNVSAVFSATDLPSLLRFLHAQPNIIVDESDDRIRILQK